MLALRFYIDKKTDAVTGLGGDHSRVIDVGELDEEKARALVAKELKTDEEIGHLVSVTIDDADYPVL